MSILTSNGVTIPRVSMPPSWPTPQQRPPRWPLVVLTVGMFTSTALSAGALAVALTRRAAPEPTHYTAAQQSEAAVRLCERYRLASTAVNIETNGPDVALARISATNGAVILEMAAADPALDAKYRDAALALAHTYEDLTAVGTKKPPDDPDGQKTIDDSNAKYRVMRSLCGE